MSKYTSNYGDILSVINFEEKMICLVVVSKIPHLQVKPPLKGIYKYSNSLRKGCAEERIGTRFLRSGSTSKRGVRGCEGDAKIHNPPGRRR